MIQVTNVQAPVTTFPKLQSELKPNSLYKDFEGDAHLVGDNNLLVGYFVTRCGSDGPIIFVSNRERPTSDISLYKLVPASATIAFS